MSVYLTACTVQFFTGNKTRGTDPLTVQIREGLQQIAVTPLIITDKFEINSPSKLYHLEVIPHTLKSAVDPSKVWLSIEREGKIWEFNFALDAVFSDGTKLCCARFDEQYTTDTTDPPVDGRSYSFRDTTFDFSGPELTSSSIEFHSDADGKLADTHLLVIVKDQNGYVSALTLMDESFGVFPADTTHSPIKLHLRNKSLKGSFPKSKFVICITPVATETWNLDYTLHLGFADGSSIVSKRTGLLLNSSNHPFIEELIG